MPQEASESSPDAGALAGDMRVQPSHHRLSPHGPNGRARGGEGCHHGPVRLPQQGPWRVHALHLRIKRKRPLWGQLCSGTQGTHSPMSCPWRASWSPGPGWGALLGPHRDEHMPAGAQPVPCPLRPLRPHLLPQCPQDRLIVGPPPHTLWPRGSWAATMRPRSSPPPSPTGPCRGRLTGFPGPSQSSSNMGRGQLGAVGADGGQSPNLNEVAGAPRPPPLEAHPAGVPNPRRGPGCGGWASPGDDLPCRCPAQVSKAVQVCTRALTVHSSTPGGPAASQALSTPGHPGAGGASQAMHVQGRKTGELGSWGAGDLGRGGSERADRAPGLGGSGWSPCWRGTG